MREVLVYVLLVECVAMFCFLTFVETTNIINEVGFKKSLEKKHKISAGDDLMSKEDNKVNGKRLRKKRRLRGSSFYGRKHSENHLMKRIKKEIEGFAGEAKKRNFFFTPASSYGQMLNPLDRRMFLVHRGERGN